jgi:hypothetical protein
MWRCGRQGGAASALMPASGRGAGVACQRHDGHLTRPRKISECTACCQSRKRKTRAESPIYIASQGCSSWTRQATTKPSQPRPPCHTITTCATSKTPCRYIALVIPPYPYNPCAVGPPCSYCLSITSLSSLEIPSLTASPLKLSRPCSPSLVLTRCLRSILLSSLEHCLHNRHGPRYLNVSLCLLPCGHALMGFWLLAP